MKKLHEGSTTAIFSLNDQEPSDDLVPDLAFKKFDWYSVFDWGHMPDKIPLKGYAQTMSGAFMLDLLEKEGIGTHFRGLLLDMEVKPYSYFADNKIYGDQLVVGGAQVLPIDNDYEPYRVGQKDNYMLPLEIVYRNGLPEGSSFFSRAKKAESKQDGSLKNLLDQYGLDTIPEPDTLLPEPVYEYWTKREPSDRLISPARAMYIAGLEPSANEEILEFTRNVNKVTSDYLASKGFIQWDGKIELYIRYGDLGVGDVVGNLDEIRTTYDGQMISKQPLREYYKDSAWKQDVDAAKDKAEQLGELEWKKYCEIKPEKLELNFLELISNMYQASTNQITGTNFFDCWPLIEVVGRLREYQSLSD